MISNLVGDFLYAENHNTIKYNLIYINQKERHIYGECWEDVEE